MANFDIYAAITDRIIAELENGIIPWRKPWTGTTTGAISRETGRPYSLLNQMLLGTPGEYLTWNQVKKEGGSVKKGAKAKMVVFWKVYPARRRTPTARPSPTPKESPSWEGLPVLRYFNVFHIDDCEGIKPKYTAETTKHADPTSTPKKPLPTTFPALVLRFENVRQDQAYYSPSMDLIRLPLMEQFPDTAEYYSTLFHEATHSTGHPKRLDRLPKDAIAAHFGSEGVQQRGACRRDRRGLHLECAGHRNRRHLQKLRRLYPILAQGAQERQANDRQRRRPRRKGRQADSEHRRITPRKHSAR